MSSFNWRLLEPEGSDDDNGRVSTGSTGATGAVTTAEVADNDSVAEVSVGKVADNDNGDDNADNDEDPWLLLCCDGEPYARTAL